jgi:UDP-4-amino-4,6-dideoxy-N-acetyl-beta-L-altrosamine transaminase
MNETIIPYGKQSITDDDLQAVQEALLSNYLTQGPKIKEFENKFADYVGAKYAVAVTNGTAALHIAVLSLGLQKGDRIITTPITFAASANCAKFCGADVDFVDIDPTTYLIDINKVRNLLENSPKGTYKGIIPVQFAGRMVDMEELHLLAREHNLWIVEDACHAPGAFFIDSSNEKQCAGNGNWADLSVFSFHPVKHIACGEGGMITTNDENLYKELNRLRSHGITKGDDPYLNDPSWASGLSENSTDKFPGWYMEMQELGFNYRITDIQAALGVSQLIRADAGLERRRLIAKRYYEALIDKDYVYGQSGNVDGHAYHLYVVEFKDRIGLYNYLRTKNVFSQVHYIPVHLMPYYKNLGWKDGDMPLAENYYKNCLSLPMYPTLSDEEQQYVIDTIGEYYAQ